MPTMASMTTANTINAIFQKRDMQNSWIEPCVQTASGHAARPAATDLTASTLNHTSERARMVKA
jgi:hypothetical protein